MNANELYERLRFKYRNGGWVLLCDVGDGAGFGNSGWSDAIAMQTWPSKGLEVLGFEVKVSRSDWKRELDKREKNATWQTFCDEWYIVAPEGIVKLEELPTAWGLMVPSGSSLRIAKRSERPDRKTHYPRDLVAAVFRAAGNVATASERSLREIVRSEEEAKLKEKLEELRGDKAKYDQLRKVLGARWASHDEVVRVAELVAKADVEKLKQAAVQQAAALEHAAAELRRLVPGGA